MDKANTHDNFLECDMRQMCCRRKKWSTPRDAFKVARVALCAI